MAGSASLVKLVCERCQSSYTVAAVKAGAASRCPKCGASSKGLTSAKRTGEAKRAPAAGSRTAATPASWHDQETLEVATSGERSTKPEHDAAPKPPPALKEEATRLGKLGPYEILEEIGRGGMGLVLKGRDANLRREVAIKILRPESQHDDQRRLRFTEEAQVTGQLEHPGIVPVHFLGEDAEGRAFFSMKLVSGQPLDKLIQRWHAGDAEIREDYPLARLVSIFERVVETVGFAHAKGILHRDLKPGNVMVGTHGEVWLMDWGLAKAISKKDDSGTMRKRVAAIKSVRDDLGKDLTMDGLTVGTPEYMSPEQAAGEGLDECADVFGLGGILYALLTGQAPIRGKTVEDTVSNAAHGKFLPVRRTSAGKQAPLALVAIAEKCLSKDKKDRYRTARQLLRDLRAYAGGEAISALPDSFLDKLQRYARRHRSGVAMAGAVAGLLLLTLTAASMMIAGKERDARNAQDQAQAEKLHAQEAETKRMDAESKQLQAELQKQKIQAASAEKAQRRMQAFEPYAQATDLLMRGQLPAKSAELLKKALAIDPEFPEAQFALGEALRYSGTPFEAAGAYVKADELARAITGRPHLQAIIAAGFAYDGAGYYKQAEEAFERAELNGASDPLAMVGKIFRLAHSRELLEARKLADETLRAAPHLWESHFAVAYVAREMAEEGYVQRSALRDIALPEFKRALELSPRQAETLTWLAICTSALDGDTPAVMAYLDRAVALEPANGNRYLSRSSHRAHSGDLKGAQEDVDAARRLKSSPNLLLMHDAIELSKRNDTAGAFEKVGTIIRESCEWPPLVANYLSMALKLDKTAETRELYERWRKANPRYPQVFAYTAALCFGRKDLGAGMNEIEAGLKLAPYALTLLYLKAEALVAMSRYSDALKFSEEQLKEYPNEWSFCVPHLKSLVGLKRFDDALEEIAKLEKEQPVHKDQLGQWRTQIQQLRGMKTAP